MKIRFWENGVFKILNQLTQRDHLDWDIKEVNEEGATHINFDFTRVLRLED